MSWGSSSNKSYSAYQASLNGTWSWKDSYRWVDFDADASAEVDEQLTHYMLNTNERNFSFPLSRGEWFQQQRNRDIYTCHVELNYSRKQINKIYQKNKNTSYQREMRRTPAFQLPSGDKKKLQHLFDKTYADKEEKDIMSESGMLQFFKDMGVNPESHETLVVSYMINAEEMGIISRDEFVNGFYAQGCSSLDELKKCVQDKCKAINRDNKQWRSFYKWVFQYVKEDEKKKTIDSSIAIQLWNILFQKDKHSMKLADQWMKYADAQKDKELKVVSKDLWEQIYDFLKETKSVDDYDDAGGSWPVAVDEFVEWLQEQKK